MQDKTQNSCRCTKLQRLGNIPAPKVHLVKEEVKRNQSKLVFASTENKGDDNLETHCSMDPVVC